MVDFLTHQGVPPSNQEVKHSSPWNYFHKLNKSEVQAQYFAKLSRIPTLYTWQRDTENGTHSE